MLPTLSFQPITLQKKYDLNTQADLILDKLHALGVKAIEGGSSNPADFAGKLKARGMVYSGTHIALSARPDVTQLVTYLKAVGGSDVLNSGITEWNKPTILHYRESIPMLNEIGKRLRDEGIHFHYHNHAFEFDKIDGQTTGMDLLLQELDPRYVGFCFDVAWVWRGREDPASYLLKHAGRATYLHLKDTDESNWKELGTGKLKWPGIIDAIKQLPKVRFAAIEQDKVEIEPWESVAMSRRFLRDTFGW